MKPHEELRDPKQYAETLFKKTRRRVIKKEIKSSGLFFFLTGGLMLVLNFLFGPNSLLGLAVVIGIILTILFIGFVVKMILNKKYRESFLSFLTMDDYDDKT